MSNPVTGQPWTAADKATLRRTYSTGGIRAAQAALPSRTASALFHKAQRMGLNTRRRRWTKAHDVQLTNLWLDGTRTLEGIARRIGRTPITTYQRGHELGLTKQLADGREYLTAAARRTGYETSQLRQILKWAGVRLRRGIVRPGKARNFHCVEPLDVDDAIEKWSKTEPVQAAARRIGIEGTFLRLLLKRVGIRKKVADKRHLRVTESEIDRALASRVRVLGPRRRAA